jgi:hypothetical protein
MTQVSSSSSALENIFTRKSQQARCTEYQEKLHRLVALFCIWPSILVQLKISKIRLPIPRPKGPLNDLVRPPSAQSWAQNTSLVISRPRSWSSRSLEFGLRKSCSWSQDLCHKSWFCSQDLLSRSWLSLGLEAKVLALNFQDQDLKTWTETSLKNFHDHNLISS